MFERPSAHRNALGAIGCAMALLVVAAGAGPAAAIAAPAEATAAAVVRDGSPRVRAELLVHPDDAAPFGPVRVGVLLRMSPGWHVYGPEPGDSGLPTLLRWEVDGGEVGAVAWPPVETFSEADGRFKTYGFSGEVLLAAPLTVLRTDPPVALVGVSVELLACNIECVPARFSLRRALDETGSTADADETRRLFVRYAPQLAGSRPPPPARVSIGLAAALGLAFLGGLVLNLMPCVLPVLAIKLVTLAELARRERGEVIAHTLAYTSGVLSTLLALGAVVAMLRAGGTAVGWGFQFQEPVFIAGIATVLVVFALNLFGVFEIQLGAGRLADLGSQATGARRSFFEGLLIVVLATPCSAPFLGTAVGFAFAGSAPVILAVFGAIGLGLAAPYVAIAFAPGWARWLPRSGGWMLHLRAGLGFVLLATAVWLLWIFGRNAGADGMAALLLFLVVVAAGVCGLVWLTPSDRPRVSRAARAALACSVLIGLAGFEAAFDDPVPSPSVGDSNWEPYDRELVARRVSGGKPAFVAFTADWCITCKLNEHSVLANDVVQEEFARHEVGLFEADWTRRDEDIQAELARFGRAGVPLYLVYRPYAPDDPMVLPDLLRVRDVVAAISRHPSDETVSRVTSGPRRTAM